MGKALRAVLFVSIFVSLGDCASLIPLPSQRTDVDLSGPWSLAVGDTIQTVSVPANIPFTFGLSTWSKIFDLSLENAPGVVVITFGGVVNTGSVRLNGWNLGVLNPFSETRFDVTALVNLSGQNLLVVTLDDRLVESTVPGGPTQNFLASLGNAAYTTPVAWSNRPGIIRPVTLTYSPSAIITDADTLQAFDAQMSNVSLAVSVKAAGAFDLGTRMQAAVALHGTVLGTCTGVLAGNGVYNCSILIQAPSLWSPSNPVLYDLSVALLGSQILMDAGYDRIGFRKVEARGNQLYLNNTPIFLRGIARHDIYGDQGFVANDYTVQQDLIRIKSLGINYIRSVHYPPSQSLARYADEYGILLSEEIPAWANFDSPQVAATAGEMMQSLLRRDMNRSSVVMYLLGSVNQNWASSYIRNVLPVARNVDSSRLFSIVFDDGLNQASDIAAKAAYSKTMNLDFYCQNTYWPPSIYQAAASGFPLDFPMVATEWAGSEGSDRGPIGSGLTTAFPSTPTDNSGNASELASAQNMIQSFTGFVPYICTITLQTACLAGVSYFDWQDIDWPSIPYFYPNHLPYLRNGIVYEDRTAKGWPMRTLAALMSILPN